jgi:serine protease inhibitor
MVANSSIARIAWTAATAMAVAAGLLLIAVAGCSDKSLCPTGDGGDDGTGLALTREQLVEANNEFAFRFFAEMAGVEPDSNVFVSPLSVSMALGMTMNGAAGQTLEDMLATLGFAGYSIASADQCYRDLIDYLVGLDPAVTSEIANSLWARQGVPFEQPFIDACATYFDAATRDLDFTREDAADTINAWVKEKTHDKIDEIVLKPIPDETWLILLNAVYFLADWKYQFDPANTKDEWFHPRSGGPAKCRMMSRPAYPPPLPWVESYCDYRVVLDDRFQAVDLPYGDSLFTMTLVLPRGGWGADSVVSWLSPERWETLTASFHTCQGVVRMPRFRMEYEATLNSVLESLGMGIAFSDFADFSKMCSTTSLCITSVRHKVYIRVDEVGTEAAAVTEVDAGPTSVPPECTGFVIQVDHPYVLVIRENRTNAILFMGKIMNPGYFTE